MKRKNRAEENQEVRVDKEQEAFNAGRQYQANQDNNSGWGWWWIFLLCLCCLPIILCPIGFVYWW